MSVMAAVMGPLSEYWYFRDYWQPMLLWRFHPLIGGLEDVLFGFAIGGIAAVLYEEILGQRLERRERKQNWILLAFASIGLFSMVIFNNVLGINSIFASCIGFLLTSLVILRFRPDLLRNALLSGLFLAGVMFAFYFFYFSFFLDYAREIFLLHSEPWAIWIFGRIPLTEMLWAVCWGMVGGPLYEFWRGYRLRKT